MKISHKVPLIASLIVLIAFSLFSFFQYRMTENNLYEQLESNIDETSITLDFQISNWLNGKLSMINSLADIAKHADDVNDLQNVVDVAEGKLAFQLVYFVSEQSGKSIFNDPNLDIGDIDGRERPWYLLAKSSARATLTEAYVDETSDFPMISAVSHVVDKNSLRNSGMLGVLGGDISTQNVSAAMNKINFNESGYVFLANQDGKIIIHPDLSLYDQNLISLFKGSVNMNNVSSLQETTASDGTKKLVKFRKVTGLTEKNWLIGIIIDKATMMKDTKTLARNAIIGTLLSALICSLALYFFMNRIIITPIKTLTEKANNISMGKIDDEVDQDYLMREDEIGKLAEGFERMRKSLSIAINKINRIKQKVSRR